MLPDIIRRAIQETEGELNFIVLGSGNLHLEYVLKEMKKNFISILL
jgi:starch synthase